MDKFKKILINTLPILALVVFIFLGKGFRSGALWFASMSVVLLICWGFWRILTGSWSIKKWSKNSLKMGTPEFKERKTSFIKFFVKIWAIAIVVVAALIYLFIVVMKKYFIAN